jgi:chromosomal replication initiator protein
MQLQQANELWKRACGILADVFSPDTFDRWIADIRPIADESGDAHLSLAVPNGFYLDWLRDNYLPDIRKALGAVGADESLAIDLSIDHNRQQISDLEDDSTLLPPIPPPPTSPTPPPPPRPRRRSAINVGLPLIERNTFASFIVGPSNAFAHAAAQAVVNAPGRTHNPLFIYGGTGLGKTHLIQAIAQARLEKGAGRVCYTTSELFTNEFISALKSNELVEFRRKYREIDLLLIDDIHFLAGKTSTQEEFFHTFNALYQSQKQIVLTSDRPLSEIANLEKRLVSRFEWGLIAEMEMADFETRLAILRAKREQLSLSNVSDDALTFIAEHVRSNIRKLEGALYRVSTYASLTRKSMTPEVLEDLLRELIEYNPVALTLEAIQRAVAEHYDIRLGDMTSKQRPANIAFPRQVAMYLCRELTDQSYPSIANAFGRNHATVIHAHDAIAKKMLSDSSLRQSILSLQQRLSPTHAPH